MISVLILTHNEELNLPSCLDSVKWSDDVVVFDSYSSDRTVEIAEAWGARVVQNKFLDYGSQREAARSRVKYRHPWVLAIDADEMPDKELIEEISAVCRDEDCPHVAFKMRRKDHFMGRWIKYSTLYPSWFIRLFRPDRISYPPRLVHEYPTINGSTGTLNGHLLHYSFNKGMDDWLQKHARYAHLEAVENVKSLAERKLAWRRVVSKDPVLRRKALKQMSFRLPYRPMFRFFYMYAFRLGVLDGVAGYHYCRLMTSYEKLIVLGIKEISRNAKVVPWGLPESKERLTKGEQGVRS
jgi:glycosyltransferase involved in cell wall biosynthesis